jgi:hypothetical protein
VWQVWVRGAVMAGSIAVMAALGVPALVHARDARGSAADTVQPLVATQRVSRASRTTSPSPQTAVISPVAAARGPVATALALQRVTAVMGRAKRGRIVLRGELSDASTHAALQGQVTLWRWLSRTRWEAVLENRPTSADGEVLLEVDQAAARSVYRLTFARAVGHTAATSAPLTVRR